MNAKTSMNADRAVIRGWHVLTGLVCFFGIIIAVNLTLAVLANTSWSGLAVENGYVASQHFNAELFAARRQAELGWKPDFGYRAGRLELVLMDKSSHPLTGFKVSVELERPSTDREDRRILLSETSSGTYAAKEPLHKGQWDADVTMTGPAGQTMRRIYRFVVNEGG
jgi:nitrogen fixation protein FixH